MDERNPNKIREELQTQEAIANRLKDPSAVWQDLVFQNRDLRKFDGQLATKNLAGCVFLGCDIGPGVAGAIAAAGKSGKPHRQCLVFPKMDWLPFRTYRADLYSVEELIGRFASDDPKKEAATYERSVD